MTDNEFKNRLSNMRETMFRISCTYLSHSEYRDDAVQEALLKAWSNRHRLRDERYMQTWVVRILINECHSISRKIKSRAEDPIEYYTDIPEQNNVQEQTEERETVKQLREALFKLNEKLRVTIVLHYIEGYTVAEISKILAIPRGTVLWRLSKARENLKKMLDGNESGERRKS